jgi:hypothetical protein
MAPSVPRGRLLRAKGRARNLKNNLIGVPVAGLRGGFANPSNLIRVIPAEGA